ncbi:MAG TPA: YfhO family protein [Saprospiraceae bacterium]|nr:YfhO family protein [Saprospiraceae bacterium]
MNIKKGEIIQHVLCIAVIILVNTIFFLPQFSGKLINQSDMTQAAGAAQELHEYNKSHDDAALWSSMFSGMPAYQIYAENNKDLWPTVRSLFSLYISDPAGSFIMGMLMFYFCMVLMGFHPILGLMASIGFGFGTNNIILYEAGHMTKVWTIMTMPFLIGGTYLITKHKYLIGAALFTFGLALNVNSGHPQMTYYLALTFIPMIILEIYNAIKGGDFAHLAKSAAILVVGVALAVGANATNLFTTYEYAKDTMRGAPILEAANASEVSTSKKEGDGLEWEYAMQWSNGVKDVFSGLIPDFVGGGSGRWVAKDSYLAQKVGMRKEMQAPTYWGDLPFTSGPIYLGATLLFLFLFSALIVKGSTKWWLVSAFLITVFLSMGKNFELFNRILFNYFPMFNKFRTPNSVLSISILFLPFLAAFGLKAIEDAGNEKTKFIKPLLISAGILGGFCLLMAMIGTSLFSFSGNADANYQQIIDILEEQRRILFRNSSFRSFLFIALVAGILWLYLKSKLKKEYVFILLTLVVLADLFGVGKTYMPEAVFVKKSERMAFTKPRPVDEQILQDKSLGYRVYDGISDPFQSTIASYFHRSIGGYHAAKLQRYQDMIVNHLSKGNQKAFDMLNTKYFISMGPNEQPIVQVNPGALGTAWYVKSVKMVDTNNEEIDALSVISPANTAVVHKEFASLVSNTLDTTVQGSVKMTAFSPNKIEYESTSDKDGMVVFSEIWYGPDKGWQAYVDGKAMPHFRANYILRAMNVPAGSHKIMFEFKPKAYFAGQNIALICTLLIILSFVGVIGKAKWDYFVKGKESLS